MPSRPFLQKVMAGSSKSRRGARLDVHRVEEEFRLLLETRPPREFREGREPWRSIHRELALSNCQHENRVAGAFALLLHHIVVTKSDGVAATPDELFEVALRSRTIKSQLVKHLLGRAGDLVREEVAAGARSHKTLRQIYADEFLRAAIDWNERRLAGERCPPNLETYYYISLILYPENPNAWAATAAYLADPSVRVARSQTPVSRGVRVVVSPGLLAIQMSHVSPSDPLDEARTFIGIARAVDPMNSVFCTIEGAIHGLASLA